MSEVCFRCERGGLRVRGTLIPLDPLIPFRVILRRDAARECRRLDADENQCLLARVSAWAD